MSVADPIEAEVSPSQLDTVRQAASGSSFYAAMRILPRTQRDGMFHIYSFCRQVDDIADDPGPRDGRAERLEQWRVDLAEMYAGRPTARLEELARTTEQFDLLQEDFLAVIDGMEMDVLGDIVAPDLATLDLYCDRVASAVGRLSIRVFGMRIAPGVKLAHHLGRALQLTNILRDIDEDAAIGRVYLPRETLAEAGLARPTPAQVAAANLEAACRPVVEIAREHYAAARAVMNAEPRRTVLAPRIMAEVYGRVLDRLASRGFNQPRQPVHVSRPRLALTVLRHMLF